MKFVKALCSWLVGRRQWIHVFVSLAQQVFVAWRGLGANQVPFTRGKKWFLVLGRKGSE